MCVCVGLLYVRHTSSSVHTAELVLTKFTSNIYFGLTYFSHEKLFCKYTLTLTKNLTKRVYIIFFNAASTILIVYFVIVSKNIFQPVQKRLLY